MILGRVDIKVFTKKWSNFERKMTSLMREWQRHLEEKLSFCNQKATFLVKIGLCQHDLVYRLHLFLSA